MIEPRPTQNRTSPYRPLWAAKVGGVQRGGYHEGYSPKLGRRVRTTSSLEYDHWLGCLEFNPRVLTFCEQPLWVAAWVDGKRRRSKLDFWARETDGAEFFGEVKYALALSPKARDGGVQAQRQVAVQRAWCEQEGKTPRVITEETIRAFPAWLVNAAQMLGYLSGAHGGHADSAASRGLLAALRSAGHGGVSLQTLEKAGAPASPGEVRTCLFGWVHVGRVVGVDDLRLRPLDLGSRFRLA